MSKTLEWIGVHPGEEVDLQIIDTTRFHAPGYVVDADYCGAWAWSYRPERSAWEGSPVGEGRYWSGDHPLPADLIEDFNAWQDRFEFGPLSDIPPGADGIDGFSWRQFHADGLRLAKRLKRILGPEYVVIYSKPFEDQTGNAPLNLLVTDSGRLVRYVHVPKPRAEAPRGALQ